MANADKNILITPATNTSSKPQIAFTGAGNSSIQLQVSDASTTDLDFVGAGGTIFSIDTQVDSGSILKITDSDGIPIIEADDSTIQVGSKSGSVVINGQGLKLPVYETSQLPPGKTGMLVYDRSVDSPKYFNGKTWEFIFPPDDYGPGQGWSVNQGADGRTFMNYTHNGMTQYKSNTGNQGATNESTALTWISGCPGPAQFAYHSGHQDTWWPMYHAINVSDDPRGKVLNRIDWQTHVNAIGNVDMFGSNQLITGGNYTQEKLWTHLGRIHFGGSGGGSTDCTVYTRYFNPNNWGYRWYMIKGVDNSASAQVYPIIGARGGWAMYRVSLSRHFST